MKKQCRGCGQVKTIDQFYRNQNRPDGRHDWCKLCHKNTVKEPSELDELIISALEELSALYEAVYPYMVQMRIGVRVGVRTLQRKMSLMARNQQIIRLGPRSGYLALSFGGYRDSLMLVSA